jgi:hypothetical protein
MTGTAVPTVTRIAESIRISFPGATYDTVAGCTVIDIPVNSGMVMDMRISPGDAAAVEGIRRLGMQAFR